MSFHYYLGHLRATLMDNGQSASSPVRTPRSRSWVFTINNPVDRPDISSFDRLRYGVYQLEHGDNGTPHLQGYLYFTQPVSRRHLSKLLGNGAYLDVARGTPEQCTTYCTKLDGRLEEPIIFGELPVKGKRNDLVLFRDAIVSGRTDKELLLSDEHVVTYMRHPNLSSHARYVISVPRLLPNPPSGTLCVGGPGTGKSHWVRQRYPTAYYKSPNTWWSGYENQSTVVFDDFDGKHCSFTEFKCIFDQGPYSAQIKNGHVQLTSSEFIICSNTHPEEWYSKSDYGDNGLQAVERRITRVLFFTSTLGQYIEHDNPAEWFDAFRGTYLS